MQRKMDAVFVVVYNKRLVTFYVVSHLLYLSSGARGTLFPSGSLLLDYGSEQTFTCTVTGPAAMWTITGLSGITAVGSIGLSAANNNARITTTDTSGLTQSSTITITGFTTADYGGMVQCINQADASVEGKVTILLEFLTPNGTVQLDCGTQQTFTCSVTGPAALWTITGLSGIYARHSGLTVANNNDRVTTTDTSGVTQSSIINITGFSTADNGGIIQCVNQEDGSVQGTATVSIGVPSCPMNVTAAPGDSADAVNITWEHPLNTPPTTHTTITYCPVSSPNCGTNVTCTSPCTVSGLLPGTEYNFTVIPANNCGSAGGCTRNTATLVTECLCPAYSPQQCPVSTSGSASVDIAVAAIIPMVVLLVANVLTGVVVFLITRHWYKKSPQKTPTSVKREDVYEQMEVSKNSDTIKMTDNPAYGPVK